MTDATNPKDRIGALKPDLSLNPAAGSIEQSRALGEGAHKYGPYNWRSQKVQARIYIAAAMRHLLAYLDGEDYSRDSTYIAANHTPEVWMQVEKVAVYRNPEDGDAGVESEWPTPENLDKVAYYTVKGSTHTYDPDQVTIVQHPVHHLGHLMGCAAILLDARANDTLIDNRPAKGPASDLLAAYTLQKPPEDAKAQAAVEGQPHYMGPTARIPDAF